MTAKSDLTANANNFFQNILLDRDAAPQRLTERRAYVSGSGQQTDGVLVTVGVVETRRRRVAVRSIADRASPARAVVPSRPSLDTVRLTSTHTSA